MKISSILRHFNVLNLLLLVIIVLFAQYLLFPLASTRVSVPIPSAKQAFSDDEETADKKETSPSPVEFTLIAEQNLFHPERKLPEKASEKELPKPEFVLYGTLIADDASFAYMDDKKATKKTTGRQKKQTALKVGDSLSGFVLKTVEPDKVVMARGEDTVEVRVIDPANKKREPVNVAAKDPKQAAGRTPAQGISARDRSAAPVSPVRESTRQRGESPSSQPSRLTGTAQNPMDTVRSGLEKARERFPSSGN